MRWGRKVWASSGLVLWARVGSLDFILIAIGSHGRVLNRGVTLRSFSHLRRSRRGLRGPMGGRQGNQIGGCLIDQGSRRVA